MSRVLAAAVSVAAEPVEQAVQHYPRTWLIAAVPGATAECAPAEAGATAESSMLVFVQRLLMSVVLAAAAPVAAEPVEQAVQHYSRTRLIPAVPAEVAARASAALAVLFLSRR